MNFFKSLGVKGTILMLSLFIIASGIGSILFERLILPQIQTIPVLRDFSFLDPRAPIVITQREEIRINDGINLQEVINRTRGALVTVYTAENNRIAGYVATNDGLIIIPGNAVRSGQDLTVVLENGTVSPGRAIFADSLSGIAFVKISSSDLRVLNEATTRDKKPGEQLFLLSLAGGQQIQADTAELLSAPVSRPSLSAVHTLTNFEVALNLDEPLEARDEGSVIVDRDGALVGLVVSKGSVVALRSDDISLVLDNFLAHQSVQVVWTGLRLGYLVLGPAEAEILGLQKKSGVLIRQAGGGLAVGDFIFEADGRAITPENSFQAGVLAKHPGDKMPVKLYRNGVERQIDLSL